MLHKSIVKKFVSLFTLLIILLTPLLAAGCAGLQGIQGLQGEPGISLTWRGSLAAAPASPQLNDAYYNTVNAKSYVWDGDSWETLAQDGAQGPQGIQGLQGIQGEQGIQGIQGERGISITWRGSLATAPVSPQLNDAYYNTADAKSYIWDGDSWEILAQDGEQGPQGIQGIQGEQGYGYAALVVAAADSLDQDADYVCNGTDDQVEINAAINALPANGGSVYLREGTYIVSSSITISKSNVALIGTGPSTVIKIKNGKNAYIDVIYASFKSNLLVKHLRIDGNKTNQSDGEMYGIYFSGVEHSKIIDCWISNLRETGIYLHLSSNNTISGNINLSNSYAGIHSHTSHNNNIFDNNNQDNAFHGIFLYASSSNIISGNVSINNGTNGITLDTLSDNTVVVGNTCVGNGSIGLALYSNNNIITGNLIADSGNNGITLSSSSNNTVSSNTSQGNSQHGIYVYSSNNNTVSGNIVRNNDRHGIYLYTSSNNTISGNTINNNSQLFNNVYSGIELINSSNRNNIQGNTVRRGTGDNKQQYGIMILSDCDYNLVANNDCYEAGHNRGIHYVPATTNFGAGNRVNNGDWDTTPS